MTQQSPRRNRPTEQDARGRLRLTRDAQVLLVAEAMAQPRPEGERAMTGVLGGVEAYTSPSQRAWYEQELRLALLAAQAPEAPTTPEALAALSVPERRALAAEYGVLTPGGQPSSSVALIWAAVQAAPAEAVVPAPAVEATTLVLTNPYTGPVLLPYSTGPLPSPERWQQPEQRHYAGVERVSSLTISELEAKAGASSEAYEKACAEEEACRAQHPVDDERHEAASIAAGEAFEVYLWDQAELSAAHVRQAAEGPRPQPEQQQAQALAVGDLTVVAPVWTLPGVLALPPVMTRESNCAQWRQHMTWADAAQERIRAATTREDREAARLDAQAEARECVRLTDRLVEMRGEVDW